MDIYELEDLYLEKRQSGMDISEIRKELKNQNIPEDQIRVIIRSIDNVTIQKTNSGISSANKRKIVGTVIIMGGVSLLITSYYYSMGGFIVLPFGPMGYGVYLLSRGSKREQRRPKHGKFGKFRKY